MTVVGKLECFMWDTILYKRLINHTTLAMFALFVLFEFENKLDREVSHLD